MSQTTVKKKSPFGWIIALAVVFLIFGGLMMMVVQKLGSKGKEDAAEGEKLVVKPERGDIQVNVIESGPLEARKTVEVKSRVAGRIRTLSVEESDNVAEGELIAVIDPQETQLQVKQNQAQLQGAEANVQRTNIEIAQRRVTAKTNLDRMRSRLKQVQLELKSQPILTNAAVTSAKSALDSTTQALELLVRVTQPQARVGAQSSVDEAKANFDNAQIEYNRRQGLLEKGYISKREFEQAELTLRLATVKVDQAKDSLNRLASQHLLEKSQTEERVRQARADYERAKANTIQDSVKAEEYRRAIQDVRDAEISLKDVDALIASRRQQQASVNQIQSVLSDSLRQLGETEIRAPVSGIVVKKLVQPGELVASLGSFSSGTPIVRIEDRSTMLVKLNINEIDVAKVTVGTPAKIKVDAFPNKDFMGRVTKIAPASNDSGTAAAPSNNPVVKYAVEVELANTDSQLKSGMSAKCTIVVLEKKNVLRLRTEAIGKEKDGRTYVLKLVDTIIPSQKQAPGGPAPEPPKTEKLYVEIGASTGAWVEIKSGVKEGDRLWKPKSNTPSRLGFMGGRQATEEEKSEGDK